MDFQKQIYETVETIAKGIIDKTGYLYKVQAVITKVDPLGNYYKFEYQGAEHTGYSVSGEKYAVNDLVYVLFTNGDPLAKKMIISRIDAYNNTIDLGSIGDIEVNVDRIELVGQNIFIQAPNGVISPQSLTIQAMCYNNAEVGRWLIDGVETTEGVSPDKRSITISSSKVSNKNMVLVSVVGTDPQLTDTISIARLSDGSAPIFVEFDKPLIAIPSDSSGGSPDFSNAQFTYKVFEGLNDVTSEWDSELVITPSAGITYSHTEETNSVKILTMTADAAQLMFTFKKGTSGLSKIIEVVKVKWGEDGQPGQPGQPGVDGQPGQPGAPAYTIALSDEATLWATDKDRNPVSNATATVSVSVYKGDTALGSGTGTVGTDTFSIESVANANNVSVSKTETAVTFSVTVGTAIGADRGEFTIPIKVNGIVFNKTFTWSCSKAGEDGAAGESAELIKVSASSNIITKKWDVVSPETAIINPSQVILTAQGKNVGATTWKYHNGTSWAAITGLAGVSADGDTLTITSANAPTLRRFRAEATGTVTGSVVYDEQTIQVIEEIKQLYTMLFSNQQINLVENDSGSTLVDLYYGTQIQTGWEYSASVEEGTVSVSVDGTIKNKINVAALTTATAKVKIAAAKTGYNTQYGYITVAKIKEGSSLHVGDTPPANPKYGTLWQDISNPSEPMLRFYDGAEWVLSSDYDGKIINVQAGVEDLIDSVGNISDSLNNYLDDNLLTPTERIEVDAEWTKINKTYSDFQSLVSTIYPSTTPDAEGIFTSFDYKELTAAKVSLEQFLDDNIFSKPDGNVSVSGNDLRSKMDAYDFAFNAVNGRLQAQIKAGTDSIGEDLSTLSSTVVDLSNGFVVVNSKVEGLGDFQRTVEGTMSFDNGELTISTRSLVNGEWVDGNFKSKFSSQELGFYEGDNKVAYINNNALYITNSKILSSLEVGSIAITKGNKRLTFRKVG